MRSAAIGAITLAFINCALAQMTPVTLGNLPESILKTPQILNEEKGYCDDLQNKLDCHDTFRANLSWTELKIAPAGTVSILVEDKNEYYCGSGGCSLYLFLKRPDGSFFQILGDGELGAINSIQVLKSMTNGYYDLQKTRSDGKTHDLFRWQGRRYVVQSQE